MDSQLQSGRGKGPKAILPTTVKRSSSDHQAQCGFIRCPAWVVVASVFILSITALIYQSHATDTLSSGGCLTLASNGDDYTHSAGNPPVSALNAAGGNGRKRKRDGRTNKQKAQGAAKQRKRAAADDEQEDVAEQEPMPENEEGGEVAGEQTDDGREEEQADAEAAEQPAPAAPAAAGGQNDATPQQSLQAPVGLPVRALSTMPRTLPFCDHATCTGVRRVVSISLYGGNPRYTNGAVRNSEIVRDAYPDWELWVYVPDPAVNPAYKVPDLVLATLKANGAKIIMVDAATIAAVGFGMNQRFLPADDPTVDRFISRDGDSRLLLRERWTMDEWEESGKPFHILRDHPSHSNFQISGGLWGAVKGALPDVRGMLTKTKSSGQKNDYMDDMNFLNADVWPVMQQKGVMQHDSYTCTEYGNKAGPNTLSKAFPYKRAGGEHVGGVYDGEDHIRQTDVALLFPARPEPACISPDYPVDARKRLAVEGIAQCAPQGFTLLPTSTQAGGASGGEGTGSGEREAEMKAVIASLPAALTPVSQGPVRAHVPIQRETCPQAAELATHAAYKDISLLGSVVATLPQAAPASTGTPALTADSAPLRLVVSFQWKKAFVNHLLGNCEGGVVQPVPAFDYHRILTPSFAPKECGNDPIYYHVAQYHERIGGGDTHYEALGGVRHNRHLLFTQGWYTDNPHFAAAYALPHLLQFLHGGPAGGRILLPLSTLAAPNVVMRAAYAALPLESLASTGVGRPIEGATFDGGSPPPLGFDTRPGALPFTEWSASVSSRWVRAHEGSPHLYYAHRMYVVSSAQATSGYKAGTMCAALTCYAASPSAPHSAAASAQCGVNALSIAGHASTLSKSAQKALHASLQPSEHSCKAVLQLPTRYEGASGGYPDRLASASENDDGPYGQRIAALRSALESVGLAVTVLDAGCSSSTALADNENVAAVADIQGRMAAYLSADVILTPPSTVSPYLQLVRRRATVLIADGLLPTAAPESSAGASAGAGVDGLSWSNGPAAAQGALEMVCESLGPACVALTAAGRAKGGALAVADVAKLAQAIKDALPSEVVAACAK